MTNPITSQISKKVGAVLASTVIAAGLLMATTAIGSAAHVPCSSDWNGDHMVDIDDVYVVVELFATNGVDIDDLMQTAEDFGAGC